MPSDLFRCPTCHGRLTAEGAGDARTLACATCSANYPVGSGEVPLFALAPGARTKSGLAESTFEQPENYGLVVKLKRMVYQDAAIGTEEYIRGKDVLDVGCGPSLAFDHLENHYRLAKSYLGLDYSAEFVLAARRNHPEPQINFAQGVASRLPLADKSVDTTIMSFVIHHIESEFERVMAEVVRVTRGHVVILDHLRSDNPLLSTVQDTYWRLFDGGCAYQTAAEWKSYLAPVKVVKTVRTGAIFGHVIKYICEVPQGAVQPAAA